MPKSNLFVQIQGDSRVIEVEVVENPTQMQLHAALAAAGLVIGADQFVFADESENEIASKSELTVPDIVKGTRIHVSRCRRIKTAVNYLDKTIDRNFAPGTRVRTVKRWALREFGLERKDAAEHILQICGSKEQPAGDTPLHALTRDKNCSVCFDLVPEIRVEG
ncbi:MAG: hypothetical protein WBO10_04030 [Pyrinomonadaceae bacterium]